MTAPLAPPPGASPESRRLHRAPRRAEMLSLAAHGFRVRDVWLGAYYDGIAAKASVNGQAVEIWSGAATDGQVRDEHYPPVVYIDEQLVAVADDVEDALRIAKSHATPLVGAPSRHGSRDIDVRPWDGIYADRRASGHLTTDYAHSGTGLSPTRGLEAEFRDWTRAGGPLDAPELLPAGAMRGDQYDLTAGVYVVLSGEVFRDGWRR